MSKEAPDFCYPTPAEKRQNFFGVFLQFHIGVDKIEERCADSNAFRWYLGIDLDERVPDHSTISQLRRRKPAFRKVFRRLFEEVVRQCIEKGLVSGRLAVTDSTHVKANASRASEEQVEMPESPGTYWERLDAYEEEGLETLKTRTGRRRKKRTRQIKKDTRRTKKRVSRTDPEAGHMKRPGKPQGQWPTGNWRSWGSISLSVLSRPMTEPRWSSNGMRSHMTQRKMLTSVQTGMLCVRKACTAAAGLV